ncbi:MAG: hypothetical protein FJ396_13330 [Verrucomicrobia bacterium]|nr:hypothetical protein [Verrucomicrobiota bacterium]
MKPSSRIVRHLLPLLALLGWAVSGARADSAEVESLRLGPLPGNQSTLWATQGLGESALDATSASRDARVSAAASARESGGRMAQWDNSPRGQSNEFRITLLELVEHHENKARNQTNATMHRMIALQALAEFAERFPRDRLLPEVLLHQALLLQDSGLPVLALDKLYSALRALPLSGSADFRYLRRLTLITQGTIADLHAEIGKVAEAAELYGRLIESGIRQQPPGAITLRRIRLLETTGNDVLLANTAKALLKQQLRPDEEAEARGRLALASLRNEDLEEARRQMQIVLEAHRKASSAERPVWEAWRLMLGNAAANLLFRQGVHNEARVIYESIAGEIQDPVWRWQATGMVARCEEASGQLAAAHATLVRRLESGAAEVFPRISVGAPSNTNALRNAAEFHTASLGRQAALEAELARAIDDNSKASTP